MGFTGHMRLFLLPMIACTAFASAPSVAGKTTLAMVDSQLTGLSGKTHRWGDSREQYQTALKHLKNGQTQSFKQYREELEENAYPLAPYLTYYEYKKNLDTVPDEEIITFIDQNWDSPISEELKQRWLKQLATQEKWTSFMQYFVPEEDASNDALLCAQAKAWLDQNEFDKAFEAGEKLWLVGRSQDSGCDPIFKAMRDKGRLNDDLIWQRLELSMHRGNTTLAKYLSEQLENPSMQSDFTTWLTLFKAPHRLPQHIDAMNDQPRHRNILLHVLTRWVRSDKDNTLHWLEKIDQQFSLTHEEKNRHMSYIARYISFTWHPESKYRLMEVDMGNLDPKVQEKRLEVALRAQDWPAVILWTNQPTDSIWEQSRLDYWEARAFEAMAQIQSERLMTRRWPSVNKENLFYFHRLMRAALSTDLGAEYLALGDHYSPTQAFAKAMNNYSNLSGLRDYYGFLASEKLRNPLSVNHEFKPVSSALFNTVERTPGFQRARELFSLNQQIQAFREWRHTVDRLPLEHKGIAARVAESWGWSYQAIVTASQSSEHNNLELRFPRAFQQQVAFHAHKNNLETDWIFAVIRQESAFRADARSHVGAMGLMQLMPGTAQHVSRQLGIKSLNASELLTPESNIRLGSSYLKELYDTFDQNIVMATAAYNAGPHRVREWRPDTIMAGDIWIDTIPFAETRDYVKNILTYQAIYKYRMGLIAELSDDAYIILPKQPDPPIQQPTQIVQKSQRAASL